MVATGAKIHVPPLSIQKDEIVVSGEKEGVHEACQKIMQIYEDKVPQLAFNLFWLFHINIVYAWHKCTTLFENLSLMYDHCLWELMFEQTC